jgi:16S rRNA processing protein RimM
MDDDKVFIAEILRPRGNRGEVLAKSETDVPGRLEGLKRAQARLADGSDLLVEIAAARPYHGDWILKLAGTDSISAAERFRGAAIWVPFADRAALPDGEFFQSDLIGCSVVERSTRRSLGTVEGWQQHGGPPLMEITIDRREVLIPFVPSICREVDLAAREILVDLPEGLLDL